MFLNQEIIVGLQRKRSGGETGLKRVEPEAGLWKIPRNHTAHIEKSLIDVFPSWMAILTICMALLTTGCEVERNFYTRKENQLFLYTLYKKMILQNLYYMKK